MEKKTVKAVTRKQKYLAAIAGDETAPSPITSDEKLMYNIAEKVNEGGGSGGGGVLVVNDVNGTLNKTWQVIHDAFVSGGVVIDADAYQNAVIGVENSKSGCIVIVAKGESWSPGPYIANSTDGYPTNPYNGGNAE